MAHRAQCRGAWVRLLLSDTNTGLQTEALRAPDMAVFTCRPQRPPGSPSIRTLCSAGASPHPGLLMLRACGLRGGAFPGTCGGQTPRTGTTAHTGQGSPQAPRQLSRFLGLVLQLDWGGEPSVQTLAPVSLGKGTPQGSHITPAPNAHLQLDHPGVQPKNLATCVLANSPRLLARAQGGQDSTRGQSTGAPGD